LDPYTSFCWLEVSSQAYAYIPSEHISVVVGLLTLLVTMIGSNLRSIVSESGIGDKKVGNSEE